MGARVKPDVAKTLRADARAYPDIWVRVNKKVDISDGYEKYQIEYKASRIHLGKIL